MNPESRDLTQCFESESLLVAWTWPTIWANPLCDFCSELSDVTESRKRAVSSATATSEVDQIPAQRFGGRSRVDRPAPPATAARADAAQAGAARAGAAGPGLREHYPISAVIVEFGRIVALHRCPVTRYHIH